MKQTKNALSMLLNAYRAIFKSAYFKGMASAVILTAGLAAGAANAAILSGSMSVSGDITINGAESGSVGEYQYVQVASGSTLDLSGHNFTITSGAATTSGNHVGGLELGSGSIVSGGTLTINVNDETATSGGLLVGQSGSITFNNINVERGLLKLGSFTASVNALETLSVGQEDAEKVDDLDDVEAVIEIGNGAVVGVIDDSLDIEKSTNINILGNGKIEFTYSNNNRATLKGGTLTIDGGAIEVDGNQSGGTVKFAQGSMNDGLIKVGSGATLTFELTQLKKDGEGVDMFFNANGGVIDVDGTLKLQTSGGEALYDFSSDGLTLTSTGEVSTGTPTIEVSGDAANSAVLKISTSNLDDFLTSNDGDNSGSVVVSGNGVLRFSDDVTLNDFEFANSASGGKIVVASGAEVQATNLTIDGKVEGGDTFSGSLVATNLDISTSSFTDTTSGAGLSNGSAKIVVYEDFNATAENFNLDAAVQLGQVDTDTTSTVQDTTPGTFEAVNLTITSDDLTIKGDYSFDAASITVSGATVKVGDGEYANVSFKTDSGDLDIDNSSASTFTV